MLVRQYSMSPYYRSREKIFLIMTRNRTGVYRLKSLAGQRDWSPPTTIIGYAHKISRTRRSGLTRTVEDYAQAKVRSTAVVIRFDCTLSVATAAGRYGLNHGHGLRYGRLIP